MHLTIEHDLDAAARRRPILRLSPVITPSVRVSFLCLNSFLVVVFFSGTFFITREEGNERKTVQEA